jgi:hypothetical protein
VYILFVLRPSKIHVNPTDVVSSIFPLQCHVSSGRRRYAVVPCLALFSLSQDELTVSVSSSENVSSCRLHSPAETEALNPHHRRVLPSSDRPTFTIHRYKKDHLNIDHSSHHSIVSLFCLLPSQSTTSSKLHPPSLFSFTILSHSLSLHITTFTMIN